MERARCRDRGREGVTLLAMEIYEDVVAAIGNTPLVRLARMHPPGNLVAKLEYINPGGSTKDRIALGMIERAERNGWLKPGGTIVEPTSGNTGVGLAMVAALRGYRLVAVMADKQSKEKQDLLRAYGAEVVVCPTDVEPDDPRSYYSVADRLTTEIPGAYRPDQYSNPANPQAHYEQTGPEIWEQTGGEVDALVVGLGTGGSVTGMGRFLKERKPDLWIVGVDPEGSIYTAQSDGDVRTYLTEGVGEDFWPGTFDPGLVDGGNLRRRLRRDGRCRCSSYRRATSRRPGCGAVAGLRPQLHLQDLQRRLDAGQGLSLDSHSRAPFARLHHGGMP